MLRTDDGEEQIVDLSDLPSDDKENVSLPSYLPDEDSPVKVCVTSSDARSGV